MQLGKWTEIGDVTVISVSRTPPAICPDGNVSKMASKSVSSVGRCPRGDLVAPGDWRTYIGATNPARITVPAVTPTFQQNPQVLLTVATDEQLRSSG